MIINREGLEKILEAQKELDRVIFKSAVIEGKPYPLAKVTLAYNVELGELAQEWKGFKYWKKTKGEINREALIEEYADCLHFACSLTNYYLSNSAGAKRFLDAFLSVEPQLIGNDDMIEHRFLKCFDSYRCFEYGAMLLVDTLNLGSDLGFEWEEIEEAYFNKNAINYKRVAGGY